MHFFDLGLLVYIVLWAYGGLVIGREARQQPLIVKLMAFIAIVLGPIAMLFYLAVRYVAQAAAVGRLLPPARRIGA
jgi:hypothetical protein